MGRTFTPMVGKKFGQLTVLNREKNGGYGRLMWLCRCDCGNLRIIRGTRLRSGNSKSCGCSLKVHGFCIGGEKNSKRRIYVTWRAMIARCENRNDKSWKNYGGRGIKVCDSWHDVRTFWQDMGDRPPGRSLDRIDVNKDYSPDNCRWATSEEQNNNRRDNRILNYKGEEHTLAMWGKKLHISYNALSLRLRYGWSVEKALSTPPREHKTKEKKRLKDR